ncbi:GlcG/HbpS family heme-binding protein [Oceanibium sediminis]|uniref:GlcG/HbpS family heme-binding protein n=1 Tax=Oceanibium sediminis TaxID=2026339 RepID=UPI000DD30369|nr:heme-binding protein [Oceanibium sediminis]
MKTITVLDEADVAGMIEAAAKEARKNDWRVSVAVVDNGGHLLGFLRQDGVHPATAQVAIEKARTAAQFGAPTGALEDRVGGRPAMVLLPGATLLRGGLPVQQGGGVAGAIGISGLAPDQDEQVAAAAVAAIGC